VRNEQCGAKTMHENAREHDHLVQQNVTATEIAFQQRTNERQFSETQQLFVCAMAFFAPG